MAQKGEDEDKFFKEQKWQGKEPSRWDLDQGKRELQRQGIYDWSRKTY